MEIGEIFIGGFIFMVGLFLNREIGLKITGNVIMIGAILLLIYFTFNKI